MMPATELMIYLISGIFYVFYSIIYPRLVILVNQGFM